MHDLHAVLVGDLVLRAVEVRLEVEPVFHARVRGVCVVDVIGAAGVVIVAVEAVGLLFAAMSSRCSIARSSFACGLSTMRAGARSRVKTMTDTRSSHR